MASVEVVSFEVLINGKFHEDLALFISEITGRSIAQIRAFAILFRALARCPFRYAQGKMV